MNHIIKSTLCGAGLLIALTFRANAQFDSSVWERPNGLTRYLTALLPKDSINSGYLADRAFQEVALSHYSGGQNDSTARPSQVGYLYRQLHSMANDSTRMP